MDTGAAVNVYQIIPTAIFGFLAALNAVVFIWGGIAFLLAKSDVEKTAKAKRILLNGLRFFVLLFLVFFVFTFITFLLRRGEALLPSESASPEFPVAGHLGSLPPAPSYIDIGKYHFWGPYLLKNNAELKNYALVAATCKNNDNYNVIYIGELGRENLLKNKNYSCWAEKCPSPDKNLYVAVFWVPTDQAGADKKSEIIANILDAVKPVCNEAASQ